MTASRYFFTFFNQSGQTLNINNLVYALSSWKSSGQRIWRLIVKTSECIENRVDIILIWCNEEEYTFLDVLRQQRTPNGACVQGKCSVVCNELLLVSLSRKQVGLCWATLPNSPLCESKPLWNFHLKIFLQSIGDLKETHIHFTCWLSNDRTILLQTDSSVCL